MLDPLLPLRFFPRLRALRLTRSYNATLLAMRWLLPALLFVTPARAQDAAPSWREIKIVVGAGAGGGYDIYARLVARHFGRFLPGSPRIIVVNMPGANGMTAAAYMTVNAKKDGSELMLSTQPLILAQLFSNAGVRFDLRQFRWIGNMSGSNTVTIVRTDSGITQFEDTRKREIAIGSASPGSLGGMYPLLMNNVLGTQFKVVNGYASGEAIDLALERGEVQGRSGVSWSTMKSLRMDWLNSRVMNLLVQVGLQKSPDLPDTPLLFDLAKNEEDRAIIRVFSSLNAFTRPILGPPGIPPAATEILRRGFDKMLHDAEFLQNANEMGLEIDPMIGEDVEAAASALLASPEAVVSRAKAAIEP